MTHLWFCVFVQVKSGTIFDNFLISDDVKEAEEFGKETWGATNVSYAKDCYRKTSNKRRV